MFYIEYYTVNKFDVFFMHFRCLYPVGEFPAQSLSPKFGDGAGTYFEDPRSSVTGRGHILKIPEARGRGGDRI